MPNLRTLNNLIKEKGKDDNTEVTRFQGKYHLLHICRNGVPVPMFASKNAQEVEDYLNIH